MKPRHFVACTLLCAVQPLVAAARQPGDFDPFAAPAEDDNRWNDPAAGVEPARLPPQRARKLPLRLTAKPGKGASGAVQASAEAAPATPPAKLAPQSGQALPLGPPQQNAPGEARKVAPVSSLATLVGSLGVVLGLFLVVVWVMRRGMPKHSTMLPREALEVLGRAPLAGRQHVHLVRLGNKLLLVSISPAGVETLSEITDPVEVDRLTGICYQSHPQSATATFRNVLDQFGRDRRPPAYSGAADRLDLSKLSGVLAEDSHA